jgi:hypothetical protein
MQDEALKQFNLAGGTALSLYMGHRKSIDIDLFTQEEFDVDAVKTHLIETYGFMEDMIAKQTLKGFINDVKVELLGYKYPHIEPIQTIDGIRLYSMKDLSAMKLSAISYPGTRLKDFIDIAFLSTELSFDDMLKAYERKFPNSNKIAAIKGLTYYDDIDFSQTIEMINGEHNWKQTEKRLREMVYSPDQTFSYFPK